MSGYLLIKIDLHLISHGDRSQKIRELDPAGNATRPFGQVEKGGDISAAVKCFKRALEIASR